MARAQRIDFEGAWMHIGDKGADGQDIFSDDIDRNKFIELLGAAVEQWGVEVHAYCLMTNHLHIVIRSTAATVAKAMHQLLSTYARWYNYRHHRTGPLFTARYHSTLITCDEQAITAVRYTHRNPLSFTRADELSRYEWSSLPAVIGRTDAPSWLRIEMVRSWYSDANQLLDHTLTRLTSDSTSGLVWSAVAVHCDDIDRVVSTLTDRVLHHAPGPRRGATTESQTLAVLLATELRAATTKELAARYGYKTPSSVRTVARRGRVWSESRAGFRQLHDEALRQLNRAA